MRAKFIPEYSIDDREAKFFREYSDILKPYLKSESLLPDFLNMLATTKTFAKNVKDAVTDSLKEIEASLPEEIVPANKKAIEILTVDISSGDQLGQERMRDVANKLANDIPGLGFALFVYEKNKPGITNYVSNSRREDMILALRETLKRFENKEDFQTPNSN